MKSMFGQRPPSSPAGADSSTAADFVFRFATASSSSLHENGTVQYDITGIMGFDGESVTFDDGIAAEGTNDAEAYTSPGMVGRPLPPRNIDGNDIHMDVVCVQTTEGLVPIAYRDVRLQMAGDAAPGEGVLAFVGYGGGFFSQTPVEDGVDPAGGGTIQVMYCPYSFDSNGVAQKAHTLILDPTPGNESIMLVHANGLALTMSDQDDHAILMKNVAGDATFRLDDNGCTITAASIVLSGGVIIGDPALAAPMLAGIASLPSTKLSYSP